jgi:glycogen debranching enzyme
MQEVIRVEDQYYILATSSLADERTRVLKQGDTFAIFDSHGDIRALGLGEQGLFHLGTRHLSACELRLGQVRPLLLSSVVNEHNELLAVDLMNPDLLVNGELSIQRDSLHIFRSKFLWQGECHERLRLTSYHSEQVTIPLYMSFAADFADIFEVRGMNRKGRGKLLPAEVSENRVVLAYEGLDGAVRHTCLTFSGPLRSLAADSAVFDLTLAPHEEQVLFITVSCQSSEQNRPEAAQTIYQEAFAAARGSLQSIKNRTCFIEADNEQVNNWLNRSQADLQMMLTQTPHGLYPYAGVPWFSTPFGRDGLITALQTLWINPDIARGVLTYLAHTQAKEENAEQDAEPGKILHETRQGEMAALGEIPFGRYYGSVDSTPLFVVLAGAYFERTGDRDLLQTLWPNICRALEWMDRYGDADGDGFLEYFRHSSDGLVQQGWKDSRDSVFHDDGRLAEGPIALCEVQGYAYEAREKAARLAEVLGDAAQAQRLRQQAADLRQRFHEAFWCEDLSTYALALDGQKQPCRVRSSNAGHALFSGIASKEHGRRLADLLLSQRFNSGWGIRTLASGEVRYNPMSYHNGSIWPHDNSMIASGLARYGYTDAALKVFDGLFHTSLGMDLHRLPELFCGFRRRPGLGPILYPLACAPQAWAAGAGFMLLQACLGLHIDARQQRVCFRYPALPKFIEELRIRDLRIGDAHLDLLLKRYDRDVAVNVLHREGSVEVSVLK